MAITWGKLSSMIENAKRLETNSSLFFAFSQDHVQSFVIELNTNDQLFEKGIDSDGVDLSSIGGDYSPRTVSKKKVDGLPFNRITLFDDGDFYRSFDVKVSKNDITISANTLKEGVDLRKRWGQNIIGLTDESIGQLKQEILPEVIRYILITLLR